MDGKSIGALLAFLFFGVFIALPLALFLYRTGGNLLDPWIWLFTGKHPRRKSKHSTSKEVTTSQSDPEHP